MPIPPRYWKGLGRDVDPIGFGCWQLAGNYSVKEKPHGWGAMEPQDAAQLVHAALDQGIQFFDTAAGYGAGRSEEVLGRALRGSTKAHDAIVCTKTGLLPEEIDTLTLGTPFKQRVEASLARLGTERIGVLLLHGPPDNLAWQELDTKALDGLVKEGKVGTYGISAISLAGVDHVLEAGFGTCVEWVFHLLERRPEKRFPKLLEQGMNFIARSPLSRGLLSERYRRDNPQFSPNEFRSNLPADWVRWTVEHMRALPAQGTNIAEDALRYCLSFEGMSVVIPGVRTPAQLESLERVRHAGPVLPHHRQAMFQNIPDHYPAWD
ncbi:MAG: aldo/keto reductase [Bacteroidetes bacterium]|nr:aldo/keto reductase [Bacteroidota bacterium]